MNLNLLEFIRRKIIVYNFKKFNKKVFSNNNDNYSSQVLVEFNAFHSDHIFLAYLSNFFSKKYGSKIIAFYNYKLIVSPLIDSFIKKIRWTISKFINYRNFGVYKSFGTQKFIKPNIKDKHTLLASIKYKKIIKKIKSKDDIYKININKVLIGDLIYDSYLKYFYEPTINFQTEKFRSFLFDFICLYFYWYEYLSINNVKAVLAVHGQYSYAILHRIAVNKNIPVILHAEGKIYRLSKKNIYQHKEFINYSKLFNKLNNNQKKLAYKLGQKLINKRLGGAIGIDSGQTYVSVSSFSKNINRKRVLKKNNKIKILISTQDFFDSVNVYGCFFFCDFYEWIMFLGKISEITDYDWYIKDHPKYSGKYLKFQPFTSNFTKEVIKKFKKIQYLDPNTSHHQIISEGIDYVCTVYGSISFEYPYFNIPVITASQNCPTIKYNFNIHSKNKSEYKKTLLTLKKRKVKFNKNKLREFYYMNFVYHNQNNLLENYTNFNKIHKNWDLYWSEKFYEFWYKNWSKRDHEKMYKIMNNFIKSKDICNNITHTHNEKNN